jgi:thiamine biosynthesis lipoprotein
MALDGRHRAVTLPAGAHLDLGAVGRAFATDLVVEALTEQGATGVLVSIGPDVRVAGEPPRAEGWLIDVDDPHQAGALGRLRLRAGAVSTCRARGSDGPGVAAVTVVAGEAWWAQALAAAAMVAGAEAGIALLGRHGVTGLAVRADGEVLEASGLDAFC